MCKKDFNVKVNKSEVVAAVLPMQEHWLPLSNLDLLLPPLDVGVMFCYLNPIIVLEKINMNLEFNSIVKILKTSLAETLVSYYAFSGEIVENSAGEPKLLCNNGGVSFIEAFGDVELKEINFYNPDESIEGKFVPKKKHGVLAIQVTQLKCGGIIVGCTFDHRVADAYSANLFLVSWSELAQCKPLSQFPSFRRSSLFPRHPGYYDDPIDDLYVPVSTLPPMKSEILNPNDQVISRINHFPWAGKVGYVMPMPTPKGNGDWIVYMHLVKWQMELIEASPSHVFESVTANYLNLI